MMNQIDLPVASPGHVASGTRMSINREGLQDLLQEVSVVLLTSVAAGYGAGLSSWCLITRKKLVWRLHEY